MTCLDLPHSSFPAGHGFYQFAVPRRVFERSLYYALLLSPGLAIPDHYFLQGSWMGAHLSCYPARDSWVETGLREGIVVPYYRMESTTLSNLLDYMEKADRRGFGRNAHAIAERLGRTPSRPRHWSSSTNSASFGQAFSHYLKADAPPMLETRVDPDDYLGFWRRSREWIDDELERAFERSTDLLGSDGLLLSQMIQVSGERLLGNDCGRIESVDDLLARAKSQVGPEAERDLRVYYLTACEIYNRSLADTMLVSANSPRWTRYVAAMDLWRQDLLTDAAEGNDGAMTDIDLNEVIKLPRPAHLRRVSGDVLGTIRRSKACERYFESFEHWRKSPNSEVLQADMVEALRKYSTEIGKQVGKEVGMLGLSPQFISKSTDIGRVLEKTPGVVQGFLASSGSAAGATALATGSAASAYATAGFFSLFCLQAVAKYYLPTERVKVKISARQGARVHADVTVSRP